MTKLIILRAHTDFRFPTWGLWILLNFGIMLSKEAPFSKKKKFSSGIYSF